MRVSDEELAGFLAAAAGVDPSMRNIETRIRYAEDLREARAALREIAARPCRGPDVSAPCYKFFGDDNRDKWCAACIAYKALEVTP